MTLEELVSKVLREPVAKLNDDSSRKTIRRWDSMSHVDLMAAIESTFGVQFSTTEVLEMESLGKIKEFLRARGHAV
jgi:acyl carrier protein